MTMTGTVAQAPVRELTYPPYVGGLKPSLDRWPPAAGR
jgi:hypothetical protein